MTAPTPAFHRIAVIALLLIMVGTIVDTMEPDARKEWRQILQKRSPPQPNKHAIAEPVSYSLFPHPASCPPATLASG